MFIGLYYHTLEAKGRLAFPAKFRRNLKKGSVITRGLDGCLFVFPKDEWEKLAQKLRQSPVTRREARAFVRLMTHQACELGFDAQGRTRIPQYLKDFARLAKHVVVAGTLTRVEIWDRETYNQYISEAEKKGGEIAERLSELGI
ncbi:MAG: cell division/cell wall cluster transcriptional repressor MraZ [Candidatus Chisholmbacteria bacterium RIFCSPLOWO2_01_FULL_50_28]|uniref:Transcriptional regulator MraZ n=1 Tax=Candidatus Chisholmbacteria bacterium RIFCSPHIGHO2_01_FULL_52_32 TaxID=1797591 RepID=A0A1G1VSS1_9BACT|nr:MAG: cell division/cell wall cluster transcriptional repressor MraZ [Candidatus Chisholmbacteria bacterium RIFCSPHIGHO2_01_FULL_52_32]OGY20173.1 MAG: cell division/cell wall cluster transcriptional repressor MraZ [Candidatus Chisholmbacteria bacterium RIFCSPLOWO2_01_FULL_50_28]